MLYEINQDSAAICIGEGSMGHGRGSGVRRGLAWTAWLAAGMVGWAVTACGGGGGQGGPAIEPVTPPASSPTTPPGPSTPASAVLSAQAQLGARLFVEKTLSASGQQSCASCHDPAAFHGPPNAQAVQPGGAAMDQRGSRATPSLRYLHEVPAFNAGDGLPDSLRGGLMADGRVDSLAQQARLPFLNPREMANASPAALALRLRQLSYASLFAASSDASAGDERWISEATDALAAFQREDPQFHPYSSRYDWVVSGAGSASAAEQRGLNVFVSATLGNCVTCHAMPNGVAPKAPFTNFGYASLGTPRNPALPDNADPAFFDLGVCGPFRAGVTRQDWCGLFRTPSLRNSARRPVFMHNGVFTRLDQVLDFYNSRDSAPERWFSSLNGQPQRFDDLPPALRGTVNQNAPFGPRDVQRMNAQQLKDLQCFLETLTDGYVPGTSPGPSCG